MANKTIATEIVAGNETVNAGAVAAKMGRFEAIRAEREKAKQAALGSFNLNGKLPTDYVQAAIETGKIPGTDTELPENLKAAVNKAQSGHVVAAVAAQDKITLFYELQSLRLLELELKEDLRVARFEDTVAITAMRAKISEQNAANKAANKAGAVAEVPQLETMTAEQVIEQAKQVATVK